MGLLSNKQQYEALVARQNLRLREAAAKPQGMAFHASLEAIACAMAANLIVSNDKADGFSKKVEVK